MSSNVPPIGPEDLGDLFADQGEAILCRVCDTTLDGSGNPIEPVTQSAVSAVQQYLHQSGAAEEGGVSLIGDDL